MTKTSTLPNQRCWLIAGLLLAVKVGAFPQTKASSPMTSSSGSTQPAVREVAAKTPATPQTVNPGQAVYLVRSTLMMLNDANHSGNYTVFRDLAAPEFQSKNSAADLSESFSDLRRRKFDLFAVSFAAPQFSSQPSLDARGRMRLTGFFVTQPLQIKFDLLFQSVDGLWKLLSISVATPEAPKRQSLAMPAVNAGPKEDLVASTAAPGSQDQSSQKPPPSASHSVKGLLYGLGLFSISAGDDAYRVLTASDAVFPLRAISELVLRPMGRIRPCPER